MALRPTYGFNYNALGQRALGTVNGQPVYGQTINGQPAWRLATPTQQAQLPGSPTFKPTAAPNKALGVVNPTPWGGALPGAASNGTAGVIPTAPRPAAPRPAPRPTITSQPDVPALPKPPSWKGGLTFEGKRQNQEAGQRQSDVQKATPTSQGAPAGSLSSQSVSQAEQVGATPTATGGVIPGAPGMPGMNGSASDTQNSAPNPSDTGAAGQGIAASASQSFDDGGEVQSDESEGVVPTNQPQDMPQDLSDMSAVQDKVMQTMAYGRAAHGLPQWSDEDEAKQQMNRGVDAQIPTSGQNGVVTDAGITGPLGMLGRSAQGASNARNMMGFANGGAVGFKAYAGGGGVPGTPLDQGASSTPGAPGWPSMSASSGPTLGPTLDPAGGTTPPAGGSGGSPGSLPTYGSKAWPYGGFPAHFQQYLKAHPPLYVGDTSAKQRASNSTNYPQYPQYGSWNTGTMTKLGPVSTFADGGVVPDTDEGASQNAPPRMASYVMGADAVPPDQAQAMEGRVDPQGQMDPTERKMRAIASQENPQQAWGLAQSYRQKFERFRQFARAAAQGVPGKPADPAAAAHAATQAYQNVPDGKSVQFAPTRGGVTATVTNLIKGGKQQPKRFDDGGVVDTDTSTPDATTTPENQEAAASSMSLGQFFNWLSSPSSTHDQVMQKGYNFDQAATEPENAGPEGAVPQNPDTESLKLGRVNPGQKSFSGPQPDQQQPQQPQQPQQQAQPSGGGKFDMSKIKMMKTRPNMQYDPQGRDFSHEGENGGIDQNGNIAGDIAGKPLAGPMPSGMTRDARPGAYDEEFKKNNQQFWNNEERNPPDSFQRGKLPHSARGYMQREYGDVDAVNRQRQLELDEPSGRSWGSFGGQSNTSSSYPGRTNPSIDQNAGPPSERQQQIRQWQNEAQQLYPYTSQTPLRNKYIEERVKGGEELEKAKNTRLYGSQATADARRDVGMANVQERAAANALNNEVAKRGQNMKWAASNEGSVSRMIQAQLARGDIDAKEAYRQLQAHGLTNMANSVAQGYQSAQSQAQQGQQSGQQQKPVLLQDPRTKQIWQKTPQGLVPWTGG